MVASHCNYDNLNGIHQIPLYVTFGIANFIAGIISVLTNRNVLKEFKVVKLSQLVNTLVFFICWGCLLLGLLQIGIGMR